MQIEIREHDGSKLLDLTGRLTFDGGARALYMAVRAELDAGQKLIVLDMEKVSFIDSTGLGELISCLTSAKTREARLILLNPSPKVEDVLRITDTYKLFEIRREE